MDRHPPAYRLVRSPARADQTPVLDEAQQAVVDHAGGPLLVLAGPGTGKTTAIVETVVDRVVRRGVDPERVLVLTFSRKAAEELRDRITARLGRTIREPFAVTFHSYAYALVRREFVLAGDEPPTLLSGPEQLLEVRRLLRGDAADGGSAWPQRLRPALATRGFAAELRDFLLRAAERGLDGPALARLGRRRERDDWEAAGAFLGRYAARFDLAPVPAYDYAEIIRIAAATLARVSVRDRERKAYDVVLVDEYQDTDPAQEALLHALAGDGRELIAVGDPDQSIYAFRGADVGAILRFPDRFRAPDGQPAGVVALRTCRRSGPVLLAASRRVARRLPAVPAGAPSRPRTDAGPADSSPRLDGSHRDLKWLPSAPEGAVRIITAVSPSQEASVVADVLRRAHLLDGVPWSSMAVLVRSVTQQVPLLRRALAVAGVPVTVVGDELPLTAEPGARPLLLLLTCALRPGALTEESAAELLTGPLGGADSLGLRRLRRALRTEAQSAGAPAPEEPLAAALRDPRDLITIDSPAAEAARRVAALLDLAWEAAREGSAHDVLWAIWDASGLAARWQAASAAGGPGGAAADRDLDAVVALFDAAARFTARLPPGSPQLFLESLIGQEIAGDTLAGQAPQPDAVRLLTAHRAKGLEWDVVVVAGVQEGVWPDLRTRSSLLGMDEMVDAAADGANEIGDDAAAAALASKLLSEERRLFYVAVTRARRSLVVSAAGGEDSEERPSRFLAELAGDEIEIEQVGSGGARWLSLPALTADLRRAAADRTRPLALRKAAAEQLARLAAAGVRGAHPGHWYQLSQWSDLSAIWPMGGAGSWEGDDPPDGGSAATGPAGPQPTGPPASRTPPAQSGDPGSHVPGRALPAIPRPRIPADPAPLPAERLARPASPPAETGGRPGGALAARSAGADAVPGAPPDAVVRVSPSQVESFARCGLRWLLDAAVGARSVDVVRHFGVVIHAAAVLAANGAPDAVIGERLDEIWPHLDFGSAWYSEKQREQAQQMVAKFLAWHRANPRRLLGCEEPLRVRIGPVEITGRVDRLERDEDGRAVIVDLKTGSTPVPRDEVDRHPQLGVYQLAVQLGGFEQFGVIEPGGAELIQVGKASLSGGTRVQRQRALRDDPDPRWARELLETVAVGMRGPIFDAKVNPGCRNCPVKSCCPVQPEGQQVTE